MQVEMRSALLYEASVTECTRNRVALAASKKKHRYSKNKLRALAKHTFVYKLVDVDFVDVDSTMD